MASIAAQSFDISPSCPEAYWEQVHQRRTIDVALVERVKNAVRELLNGHRPTRESPSIFLLGNSVHAVAVSESEYFICQGPPVVEGADGTVEIASQPTGEICILKRISPQRCRPEYRIQDEVSVMQELDSSGSIPHIYFSLNTENESLIFEEFCDGDLADLCFSGAFAQLPLALKMRGIWSLLKGMNAVHEANLVHADIRLENLLVKHQPEFRILIGDFGRSYHQEDPLAIKNRPGNLLCLAPECVKGMSFLSQAADMWAVGLVLWSLLTEKELPWEDKGRKVLIETVNKPDFPRELYEALDRVEYPRELIVLIKDLLQPDPTKRETARGAFEWMDVLCRNGRWL